jgi:hypothetical protein
VVDGFRVDAKWLANRLAAAAVPAKFRTSSSVAVDGTDVETWGALHGDAVTVDWTARRPKLSWSTKERRLSRGDQPAGRESSALAPMGASGTRWTPTPGRATALPPIPGPLGRTSVTSCISAFRHATCYGPTASTRPCSQTKSRAS